MDKLCIMATTGYSGTPLIKKLGIGSGTKLQLVNPPPNYFELLGNDISDQVIGANAIPDMVHLFVVSNTEFEKAIQNLKHTTAENPNLVVWVSWYKKSSGMNTDLTEDVIRKFALKNDLVDIKVCAVSEIWSGLKLVVPVSKRKAAAKK